jgi:DNA polymerase-3 subunit delta
MAETLQPRVLILHGDDEFGIERELKALITEFTSMEMGDLNFTRLDAAADRPEVILTAIQSVPFFTPQRLVVLDNPLPVSRQKKGEEEDSGDETDAAPGGKLSDKKQKIIGWLNSAPETTRLVLVIADVSKFDWNTKQTTWTVLKDSHYLMKWVKEHAQIAAVKGFALPSQKEMAAWVRREGSARGLRFNEAAAAELAAYTGTDTRQASQELEKLDLYLGIRREVELDDIAAICTFTSSAKIWDMLDAVGNRDTRQAIGLYHQVLESEDPVSIFRQLIGHFRQLLMTREALSAGPQDPQSLSAILKILPFQAKKFQTQAPGFSRDELRQAYQWLLTIEEDSKSGEVNFVERLDAFIIRASKRV